MRYGTGLPLTWTSGQKADFATYLTKNAEVSFTYRKESYHIRITSVSIYPQGYAAIAPFATKLTGINLIADIGNGTMNVLYMINGKPQSGKMFTEKFGTYQCTLAVREAFMRKTHREINDYIIEEVLRTGRSDDMLIIRGVNVFPSQIESVLLSVGQVEPYYMIHVDRVNNLDVMEIKVELSADAFSDSMRGIEELEAKIRASIESTLGIAAKVTFVEPSSLPRSEGKAKRVIDNRTLR